MTRITNDVDALNELFTSGAVSLIGDIFTLAGIIVILLVENWLLALVVACRHPAAAAGDDLLPARHARCLPRHSRAAGAHQRQHRREHLRHARSCNSSTARSATSRDFDKLNRDYRTRHVAVALLLRPLLPVVNLFAAVATALIIRSAAAR